MGHISKKNIQAMDKHDAVIGLSDAKLGDACGNCEQAKGARKKIPKVATQRSYKRLDLIHSDLIGPLPRSFSGCRYIQTFMDEATGRCDLALLKKKSEAPIHFHEYVVRMRNQTGSVVKVLRSDNEYVSNSFSEICVEFGIEQQFTTPSCVAKWQGGAVQPYLVECDARVDDLFSVARDLLGRGRDSREPIDSTLAAQGHRKNQV